MLIDNISDEIANQYDTMMLNSFTKPLTYHPMPKIIRFKKVKVPVYFEIDVPVIKKHYDEYGEYEGMLIVMEKKKLFRTGTRIEEVPVYEKTKPSHETIKFRRYSSLKQKKVLKKQIDKLKKKNIVL